MAAGAKFRQRQFGSRRFDLNEIKSIPIKSVAVEFGYKLTARGGGRCLLPGHPDKNPSFSIRAATNSFGCFACGEKGSVVDLVMKMEGLEFAEACGWLQDRFLGSGLSNDANRDRARASVASAPPTVTKSAQRIDSEVCEWLIGLCPLRINGTNYLKSRKIPERTLKTFAVGQTPSNQILADAMHKWGLARLHATGLVIEGRYGPRFVFPPDYLLFPFRDGETVSYIQARAISPTSKPRWICPKGILPPIYNANAILSPSDTIWICEGITDVLSADALGKAAIGVLGAHAHLDERHTRLIVKKNIVIIADADRAGGQFRKRLTATFAKRGATVVSKVLPKGVKDLNEYLVQRKATR